MWSLIYIWLYIFYIVLMIRRITASRIWIKGAEKRAMEANLSDFMWDLMFIKLQKGVASKYFSVKSFSSKRLVPLNYRKRKTNICELVRWSLLYHKSDFYNLPNDCHCKKDMVKNTLFASRWILGYRL